MVLDEQLTLTVRERDKVWRSKKERRMTLHYKYITLYSLSTLTRPWVTGQAVICCLISLKNPAIRTLHTPKVKCSGHHEVMTPFISGLALAISFKPSDHNLSENICSLLESLEWNASRWIFYRVCNYKKTREKDRRIDTRSLTWHVPSNLLHRKCLQFFFFQLKTYILK